MTRHVTQTTIYTDYFKFVLLHSTDWVLIARSNFDFNCAPGEAHIALQNTSNQRHKKNNTEHDVDKQWKVNKTQANQQQNASSDPYNANEICK